MGLQVYMALFEKVAEIDDRRKELKESFAIMLKDTKTLLCLVETVINGTRANARRRAAMAAKTHFAGAEGVKQGANKSSPVRYFSKQTMEKKLRPLTDVLTEDTLLPISKVVFQKFHKFVELVCERAKMRQEKKGKGHGKGAHGVPKLGGEVKHQPNGVRVGGGQHKVVGNELGMGGPGRKHHPRKGNNLNKKKSQGADSHRGPGGQKTKNGPKMQNRRNKKNNGNLKNRNRMQNQRWGN